MKKKIKVLIVLGFCLTFLLYSKFAKSQSILLDKPVKAGELILFPEIKNESSYYYLSDKIRIAQDEQGNPKFMFMRFVKNEDTAGGTDETIIESNTGGGIVHALIELAVTDEQLNEAKQELRRIDGDGKIIGPVIYKGGKVALISSVANPNGEMAEKILGIGTAPIMDGQKAAISIQLNKIGSKILWETFKTPTPDFSLSFEMEIEGYLSPKRVKIEADYDRLYKNQTFEAAIAAPVFSAELKTAFDELRDQGAIKVEQIGDDPQLEKLVETAYNKLTTLMFDKIGGTGVPQIEQMAPKSGKSMLDRATENLNNARKEAQAENARITKENEKMTQHEQTVKSNAQANANAVRKAAGAEPIKKPEGAQSKANEEKPAEKKSGDITATGEKKKEVSMPSLSIAVSYQLKQVKQSGKFTLDLNKYVSDTRTLRFDENVGKINCKECFLEVNLDDPLMKQRNVFINLDGMNSQEFGTYINSVDVIMRKKHQNNEETIDEVRIDKTKFNQTGNNFTMLYGFKGDNDRAKWLDYEYKSLWSFFGGYDIETDWQSTKFASISLAPPFKKVPIYIELDPNFALEENIRAIELKIYYKPKDKEELLKSTLKVAQEELSKTIEIILPKGIEEYDYEVTWFIKGQEPKISARKTTKSGLLYFDYIN